MDTTKLWLIVSGVSLALGLSLGAILRWKKVRAGTAAKVVALITLVAGSLLLSYSAPHIANEISKRSWHTTDGVITDTTRTGVRAILPDVTYTYTVDGIEYTDSTNFDMPGFGSQRYRDQTTRTILSAYAPGTSVTVHYDPHNPANSDLRPGLRWAPLMRFTVASMLLITFATLAVIARWK